MTVSENVVVLDIGKSNIKLSVCNYLGEVFETLSTPNQTCNGKPWKYHNLKKINIWVLQNLSALSKKYNLKHFITAGHGSGVVFVGNDCDINDDGTTLPMIDYEQIIPEDIDKEYEKLSGDFFDRGSKIMGSASHTARQMFWAERDQPEIFKNSKWALGVSQYWAWRLSGIAVSEVTTLGAQSHLWNTLSNSWSKIVKNQDWKRLLPPIEKTYTPLGKVREKLVKDFNLPKDLLIYVGGHDSTINFYRYQSAGLNNFCVVSTGTWIVAMADNINPNIVKEALSMTITADVSGKMIGGSLAQGGREYEIVSGTQPKNVKVDIPSLVKIIKQQTMAIPSFGNYDGPFPNSANKGRIEGPIPKNQKERHALAVLYTALLTATCADRLGTERDLILDGSYLHDPVFAQIVAMLCSNRKIYCDTEIYGIASGAALLCFYGKAPSKLNLTMPSSIKEIADLNVYANKWKNLVTNQMKG
jgi:sugar (pentulose or hexulose) kinase